MNKSWWKIVCVILLAYAIVAGLLIPVPNRPVLGETIRNIFYHVGMWAVMFTLLTCSVVQSVKFLSKMDLKYDIYAKNYASVGIVFALLGYATGTIWMSYTWADPNNPAFDSFSSVAREPKLIGTAVALLIYFAYFILRSSIADIDKRAKVSAVYNIFAYAMLFPTIMIVPRILPSLHPGQDGNPALNIKDLDPLMRVVELPAFLGWILLGIWITHIKNKINLIQEKDLLK